MKIVAWLPPLWIAAALTFSACAPPPAPATRGASAPQSTTSATQQTLVFAIRTEPPSLSAKPLVSSSQVLDAIPLFNAELDRKDERGRSSPYLAEALPKVGSDT